MKNRLLLLFPLAIALLLHACSADDTIIIAGQVVESSSGNPVEQAFVEITAPVELQQTATTDSAGNFSFDIDPGSDAVNLTLEVSKQQYQTTTTTFKVAPDTDIDDLLIRLQAEGADDGGGDDGDDDVVGGESGGPASLEVLSISSSSIAIRGTGGDEESKFTFAVKDSAGRPVSQGFEVDFSIVRGPGGGERINPSTGITSSEGIVSSAIASGDSAGVVKIKASIDRPEIGETIESTPVLVAIGNGFPEADNFRIAPVRTNFEAWNLIASSESSVEPNIIVASLGDYRNNPVLPGTAVDFTTTAGIITASAVTDEEGIALVELRPDGSTPTGHSRGVGFATVTARTIDVNNNYITSDADVLFTSRDPIITLNPTSVNIPTNGTQSFTMTITDINGYPVAAGSEISVTVSDGLTNTYGTQTLGDFTSADVAPETGHTRFNFSVTDVDDESPNEASATVTITVTLPSGESKSVSFGG